MTTTPVQVIEWFDYQQGTIGISVIVDSRQLCVHDINLHH